jgi:hypothetical protein
VGAFDHQPADRRVESSLEHTSNFIIIA